MIQKVNVIGKSAYTKNCDLASRWDLDISKEQAKKIAEACKKNHINLREVQAKVIEKDMEKFWLGDNLGRIAEGLSGGRIQLQEAGKKDIKSWKDVFVKYVYSGSAPSHNLIEQARNNPQRVLYEAGIVFPGQFVGLTQVHR